MDDQKAEVGSLIAFAIVAASAALYWAATMGGLTSPPNAPVLAVYGAAVGGAGLVAWSRLTGRKWPRRIGVGLLLTAGGIVSAFLVYWVATA
jgi:hypothetical protein